MLVLMGLVLAFACGVAVKSRFPKDESVEAIGMAVGLPFALLWGALKPKGDQHKNGKAE
jgi:hypothetical protein